MKAQSVVLFTSVDGSVKVDVAVDHENIWLTQAQMAQIFEVNRPAITKHLNNIFSTEELDEHGTCSILEHMGRKGSRTYTTKHYNLDAIIAVGYRVNSKRATQFRADKTGR